MVSRGSFRKERKICLKVKEKGPFSCKFVGFDAERNSRTLAIVDF